MTGIATIPQNSSYSSNRVIEKDDISSMKKRHGVNINLDQYQQKRKAKMLQAANGANAPKYSHLARQEEKRKQLAAVFRPKQSLGEERGHETQRPKVID